MELKEIEAFLALADEHHVGHVAKKLGVSSSRVSQLIQALERRVGGQLAVRDGHAVRLTGLGEQLIASARPGYDRLSRAIAGDVVRLGTWTFVTATVASSLCAQFEQAYPGRRAEWDTVPYADLYLPLQQGQVDVLLILLPGYPGDFPTPDGIRVGPVLGKGGRIVLLPAGHPLAARGSITVEDLADCQLLPFDKRLPSWFTDAWHPTVTPRGRAVPQVAIASVQYSGELFDQISRRGIAVVCPPWTLEDFPWPGLTAVPVHGLDPIHVVLASRDQPDDTLVADFLREATRIPIPLGHGKFPGGVPDGQQGD